ncbi:MAG: stage III sporulation protein AB [Lachnospiraceae bacterium]|nr:stage III sporulation protein AB [Lachnospiraceae bacterium]
MLRLIGALLLLAGTGGYSFCCCMEMRRRLNCLHEMKRMYELLVSQIDYCMAAFPEACRMTSGDVQEPFGTMLTAIYEEAESGSGKPFPQIWEEQTKRLSPQSALKRSDQRLLTEFSRSLGYADGELQKQAFAKVISELTAEIQNAKAHMAEREKLIMSFGVMGGLLVVIILL